MGPKTKPWGTPRLTVSHDEKVSPIFTLCCRFLSRRQNQLNNNNNTDHMFEAENLYSRNYICVSCQIYKFIIFSRPVSLSVGFIVYCLQSGSKITTVTRIFSARNRQKIITEYPVSPGKTIFSCIKRVYFKAVFTFGARALVPEHWKKIVLCSDTGNSKAPSTM